MERRYCLNCMNPIQEGQSCPNCGLAAGAYVPAVHHLPPGTVLGGRYLVGRVLGEGGFGITYLGFDLRLELRVAIKEYYPTDRVSRFSDRSLSVEKHSSSVGESFEGGRERFVQEARVMARMDKMPQIVSVRDFFLENNTAYIVMEYVDGTTFKELVVQRGGRISASELLPMVEPLFPALSAMHAQDLIHRDISPDNIMLEKGHVRLLDFGCAREAAQGSKTMTVMLKHGYSPIEQYQHKGQGPWTDVYGLAATLYYCLTGKTPTQALDRICDEELIPPRQLGADLTPAQERAILKGMGIRRSQRYGTVDEFHAALYQGAEVPSKPERAMPDPEPEPTTSEPQPGPVMPGDLTVALEPELIPVIPELEPVMAEPELEPVAAEPQPGPVMPGDLTVALEPELIPAISELEPVMAEPKPKPAPVESERFAPQTVDPPPRTSEARTDHPIEEQSEQGTQRRRQRLGAFWGIVAVVLLALLLWRLLSGGAQVGDEPPAASVAAGHTAGPGASPEESAPLSSASLDDLEQSYRVAVRAVKLAYYRAGAAKALRQLSEEDLFANAVHVTTEEEFLQYRQGDRPIVIDAYMSLEGICTVPVLISPEVTVNCFNGLCIDETILVNRGTLRGTVADRVGMPGCVIVNYGTMSVVGFDQQGDGAVINDGTIASRASSVIRGKFVNMGSFEMAAHATTELYQVDNYGTISAGIRSKIRICGPMGNDGTFSGAAGTDVVITAEGSLFCYSGRIDLGGYITAYEGAQVDGIPEERIQWAE